MKLKESIVLGLVVISAAACGVRMLPSHDEWYAMHFFIMQDFEREAYKGLTANGRLEFQKLFWESRSPALKEEFDRRMVFIGQNYKGENSAQPWNTDRARIYLLNGRPAGVENKQNDTWTSIVGPAGTGAATSSSRTNEDIQAKTLEVWSYPYGRNVVLYGFEFQPPNKWRQAQITAGGGRYLQELERKSRAEVWGPTDEEAYKTRLEELKSVK